MKRKTIPTMLYACFGFPSSGPKELLAGEQLATVIGMIDGEYGDSDEVGLFKLVKKFKVTRKLETTEIR